MLGMSKPIKILFDATPLLDKKTGIPYYTERLITSLAQKYPDELELVGFCYNFLGRRDTSALPRFKNLRYNRGTVVPGKIVFQLRRWGIEFPMELMALERADFILYPNFLGNPSLFKTPSAPVIHDLTYLDLPQYVSAKLRGDLERFVPKTINRSSFVITPAEFGKRRIHEEYRVNLNDILVTPVPPSGPLIHNKPELQKQLKKLGIGKKYLLSLGTVEPRKNIVKIIEAYKLLPQNVRDEYSLVIAGRIGWLCDVEEAAMKQAAKEGYDVIHLGYVGDNARAALYQAASLFVMASHYEGFGMPILEAMSYGVPCAISDIDVFHEVAHNAALYFNQDDALEMSDKLAKMLASEKELQTYAKAGKARVAVFSWDEIAEAVFSAIKRTLDEQK